MTSPQPKSTAPAGRIGVTSEAVTSFPARVIAEVTRDHEGNLERWEAELAKPLPSTETRAAALLLHQQHLTARAGGIDAADLLDRPLPALQWIVPELVPEGTSVLAAPPKVGKSCLVYQLAIEVAVGGSLLGRRVESGSALYYALEDGQRRGQDRLRTALGGRTLPYGRVEIRWSAPKVGDGLEDDIAAWLDVHPDARLVAIDTLGKVRPRTNGKRNAYEIDVEDLGRLQDLFRDRPGVALVIVHHARKEAGDDFLASVSGTYGITGSADTILVLKRKRLETFGTLIVTGRDVEEAEVPVKFDEGRWTDAPANLAAASFERAEVYRVISAEGPVFPKAIGDRTGLERSSVAQMVAKLVDSGAVARTTGGYVATGTTILPDNSPNSGSYQSDGGHAREQDDLLDELDDYPQSAADPRFPGEPCFECSQTLPFHEPGCAWAGRPTE